MKRLRVFLSRVGGLFRARRLDQDLRDQMEGHLEEAADEYVRQGLSRIDARHAALRNFGNVAKAEEEYRDTRSIQWVDTAWRDLHYAVRVLRRTPAFTAAAIVTLALGIGANTAMFSAIYAVLLRPLPYTAPDQLYSVDVVMPERGSGQANQPVTIQAYLEWRKADTAFSAMAVLRPWECNLAGDGEPERVGGARVSTDFFAVLGVPIAVGRGFSPEEGVPGNEKVVIVSDALWRRRYGSDPTVVGRHILVNGESHRVVGIAPPSLLVPVGTLLSPALAFGPRVDLWKPIAPTRGELAGESWDHGLFARLKAGEDPEQGRRQLQAILNRFIREQVPEFKGEFGTRLVPIRDIYVESTRLRLLLILGASGLLLLTACANIANLFLARTTIRSHEFATRIALGAGRARILSQTLTETALIALVGGALGAVVAIVASDLIATYGPEEVRLLMATRLQVPLFSFALAVSLLTGTLCAIAPARQAWKQDVTAALREATRTAFGGRRRSRVQQLLVGVELAVATILLASAGLLLHSFVNVLHVDRGYEIERVLAIDLALFGRRYDTDQSRTRFYEELSAGVRTLPGVLAAGATSDLPAGSGSFGGSQTIFASTDTDFQKAVLARPVAMIRSVTTGYFGASGTALRAGRSFTDQEPVPVALISESLASRLWPGEKSADVAGHTIRQGNVTGSLITVVGVVQDVRSGVADLESPAMIIYRPHAQWASGRATLVVRTNADPSLLAPAVRGVIRQMDSSLPIPTIRTMQEIVSAAVAQRRFQMTLTSMFALVALILSVVGVYAVVAGAVANRTKEIGLRVALGAKKSDIVRWILWNGLRPVAIGLAVGLAGAVGAAFVLRSQLFGIAPTDPASLVGVTMVLVLTSALACYLPARRAVRVGPMVALRQQ